MYKDWWMMSKILFISIKSDVIYIIYIIKKVDVFKNFKNKLNNNGKPLSQQSQSAASTTVLSSSQQLLLGLKKYGEDNSTWNWEKSWYLTGLISGLCLKWWLKIYLE